MGTLGTVGAFGRAHPLGLTVVCTLCGYGAIVGTFLGLVPYYPTLSVETSTRLSHAIAGFNASTLVLLLVGWRAIRRGQIRRHQFAMTGAVVSIGLFLATYLLRVGGGGTKLFVGPALVRSTYLAMLAIHILLSVLAVPLVLYVFIYGVTHRVDEMATTPHPRLGRVAVASWVLSLTLGLVTYVLLEHVYAWEWAATTVG